VGWAIGHGEEYENQEFQDQIESQAIYNLLENAIVPLFYQRGRDNLPAEWTAMMKKSMQAIASQFNSHRMVEDYVNRMYLPSAVNWHMIRTEDFTSVRDLTSWIMNMRARWSQMAIMEKRVDTKPGLHVGDSIKIEVVMQLGEIAPQDISVDIYYGRVDSKAEFLDRATVPLRDVSASDSMTVFRGEVPCREVGRFGFRVRVLPAHPLLRTPHSLGLILWG
jgi:starch phosphorylase